MTTKKTSKRKNKTYKDGYQDAIEAVWKLFNKNGISIIADKDGKTMNITIAHEKHGELPSSITFSRPSESGILTFLPDKDWMVIKGETEEQK